MDSLTADLILRNQNAALVEAEELIQSWLIGVEGSTPTLRTGSDDSSVYAWAGEHPMMVSQRPVEKIHKQQSLRDHPRSQHPNSDTTSELYHPASLGHPTSSKHTPFDSTVELETEAMGFEGSLRREQDDYLSGLDWSDGDVGMNARAIVDGLMKTSSVNTHHAKTVGGGKKSHDPRVTMEMRHREVQQRRKAKDQERSRLKQSQLAAREAQREAEMVVRREEERKRRERVREEALIREQMATIRREMKENQQRKKVFEGKLSSLSLEHPECEAVLQCASEVVRGERREARRREIRTELVRQLQEAEATEAKDRLKLLHWCFSHWYTLVVESRAKLGKATAIGDWKLLLRVWQAWRTFVSQRRARKERDRLARELQRERTYTDLARRHHTHRLQLRCFSSWLHLTRTSQRRRKVQVEAAHHQEKMAALLQAAALGRVTRGSGVGEPFDQSTPAEDGGRKDVPEKIPSTRQAEDIGEHGGRREPAVASGPTEPIIWQTARRQLDKLLLDGSKRPVVTLQDKHGEKGAHKLEQGYQRSGDKTDTTAGHSLEAIPEHPSLLTFEEQPRATSTRPETVSQCRVHRKSDLVSSAVAGAVRRPKPKPTTKPIPMSGMEMRSVELSQRRKAREQRKRDQELERVAQLQREEEEKREAERKAREVLTAQRREERRIARQRELEHQQRQQRLTELTSKAVRHYEQVLVKNRGLKPWRKFVELVREQCSRAAAFHEHWLLRGAFLPWRGATVLRVQEKETKADSLCRVALMRRAMQTWKEQVEHTHSLEDLAVLHHPTLLLGCVFRGWCRVTREERVRTWEQERRAKKHHERYLKHRVLRAWVQFIPLSREEKIKELHRAELRRKVAAWLPDYQPRNFGQDQAEPD